MSSTGPGSLLVFLAFLMLSMLLAGTYFMAYLGLAQAGREVQKAGEAASEQAIVYLFQHPTNISMVDGRPVMKGETRIVIQNVGSRDISFDRILAISLGGSVVADVKVPGNKGLGVRQWQLYKVQDLGLPERWNNFTIFSSEVSRLVLLSDRGRTHGSIWGVPPFLEGILRATVATTMTTSYFYSYIETTSYQTTYTITLKARQSRYSLTGEWRESNDGKNWYKVTSNDGRESTLCPSGWGSCYTYFCPGTCCSGYSASSVQMNPNVWAVASSLKAGTTSIVALDRGAVNGFCRGWQLTQKAVPVILYFRSNESVTASGINGYSISGVSMTLYEDCWSDPPFCLLYVTEWGRTYKLQAIELVNWDTGEVYASVNQTSVTFNINANTIVRFKYVMTESWSRSWTVILPPKTPEPPPEECQRILNDPNQTCKTIEWCRCASRYDPAGYDCCKQSCLYVAVSPCCTGDTSSACLDSWSGQGGQDCKIFSSGTQTLSARWSASWSLKSGWTLADIGKAGPGTCYGNSSGNSASGTCSVDAEPNRGYHVNVIVIFKKTQ